MSWKIKKNRIKCREIFILFLLSAAVTCIDCCSSRVILMTDIEREKIESQVTEGTRPAGEPPDKEFPSTDDTLSNRSPHNEADLKLIHLIISTECSSDLKLYYCWNGGKCFNFTIGNSSTPFCECSDGFWGERCELKYSYGGSSGFYPQRISMARVYIGSFIAAFLGIVAACFCWRCILILFRSSLF